MKGVSLIENVLIGSLILIKCVLGLLIVGYLFRIVKSLGDAVRLPAFNSWFNMFVDGVKVFLVNVVYFMPIILIILIFLVLLSSNSGVIFKFLEFYPLNIVNVLFMSLFYLKSGIWFIDFVYGHNIAYSSDGSS